MAVSHRHGCNRTGAIPGLVAGATNAVDWVTRGAKTTEPENNAELLHRRLSPAPCSLFKDGFVGYTVLNSSINQVSPNHPLPFASFNHGSSYEGLFVDPIRHFAFCTIEKNACSEWSAILHKLWTNNPFEDRVSHGLPHLSATYWGASYMNMVFSNPAATRAVFVREPLARFASAFLDKCTTMSCGNPFCFARKDLGNLPGTALTMRDVVTWMLSRDPAVLDGHWRLQSEHCELKTRVHEYNMIGFMRKDTLSQDSRCVMEKANITRFNEKGPAESPSAFWQNESSSGELVPHVDRPLDSNGLTDIAEEEVLKKLFTTDAARALISHFKQDYETFRFEPEPAWVLAATGEWYEVVPPDFCQTDLFLSKPSSTGTNPSTRLTPFGKSSDAEFFPQPPDVAALGDDQLAVARMGEDDVVRLAQHAGFLGMV